jgi:hypothetical protein
LEIPGAKMALLHAALSHLVSEARVDTHTLRSLTGVWIWAALLRRDVLCIPQLLFKFLDWGDGAVLPWWESVRREVRAMAAILPLVYADLGAPLAPVIFATDAQGAENEAQGDVGGWGAVCADFTPDVVAAAFRHGMQPGRTLLNLRDVPGARRRPDLQFRRNVPFSRLPAEIIDGSPSWVEIGKGRWCWGDHITLGEMRVVVWIARLLAATPFAHRHRVLNLEDNWATSGSCRKGRSCSNSLNFLLRKKTASTLASETSLHLPWVQTDVQPADEASRTC